MVVTNFPSFTIVFNCSGTAFSTNMPSSFSSGSGSEMLMEVDLAVMISVAPSRHSLER